MKKFRIELYDGILDDELEMSLVVECESEAVAERIRWAMCKTYNLYGSVVEIGGEDDL